jgi:hypothetical protein
MKKIRADVRVHEWTKAIEISGLSGSGLDSAIA